MATVAFPKRAKRVFANDDERREARNSYLRDLYARKKAAEANGEIFVPKQIPLPISSSCVSDRNEYMKEYYRLHREQERAKMCDYRKRAKAANSDSTIS